MIALALVAACGGSGGSDRDELVELLQQPDTADLSESDAECVADRMIAAGLTDEQFDDLADFDAGDLEPGALAVYRDARDACELLEPLPPTLGG